MNCTSKYLFIITSLFEYARKIPINSHALKLFYVATTDFPIKLFKTQKTYTEESLCTDPPKEMCQTEATRIKNNATVS